MEHPSPRSMRAAMLERRELDEEIAECCEAGLRVTESFRRHEKDSERAHAAHFEDFMRQQEKVTAALKEVRTGRVHAIPVVQCVPGFRRVEMLGIRDTHNV